MRRIAIIVFTCSALLLAADTFTKRQREFWSFQRASLQHPPVVVNTAWARNPIDRFILAKLEAKNIKPGPAADKVTLLRRASFDLIGLPPTPEEVQAFLADTDPHAYERQATLINLEGRLQHQEGGAMPPPHARADWAIVGGIAQKLGVGPAPESLDIVRSFIGAEHPHLAEALRQEMLFARV